MIFKAYSTKSEANDHTFAYFEYDLQHHLGSKAWSGVWHLTQPGLFETKKSLKIENFNEKSYMIFPAVDQSKWDDFDQKKHFLSKTMVELQPFKQED